jgi:hypothetical protein
MRRGLPVAVAVLLLVAVASGCRERPGGDGSADDRARARADVQQAARSLLAGAEAALPARVADPVSRWEGCTSSFPEGWATVRWSVEARLDVSPGARTRPPYLAPLRPVLEEAGFERVSTVSVHAPYSRLEGRRDEVEATVTHPGAGRFVLVVVRGACVDAGAAHDGVR